MQKKVLSLLNLLKIDHFFRLQVKKNSSIRLKSPLFRTTLKLAVRWTRVRFKHTLNASLNLCWFSSSAFAWSIDKIAQKLKTSSRKQNPRWGFLCFMIPLHTAARHTHAFLFPVLLWDQHLHLKHLIITQPRNCLQMPPWSGTDWKLLRQHIQHQKQQPYMMGLWDQQGAC